MAFVSTDTDAGLGVGEPPPNVRDVRRLTVARSTSRKVFMSMLKRRLIWSKPAAPKAAEAMPDCSSRIRTRPCLSSDRSTEHTRVES